MFKLLKKLLGIKPRAKDREWLIWVGDGMAANAREQIGRPVDLGDGRKGKVVDATHLMIEVEWEC